ncbi:MAG TPA: outer membrane protein assembly factor BamA [Nitrospiria bacterium]|nr:outer membrane protein assembly factor BamA [Nitrospiria bacterium]
MRARAPLIAAAALSALLVAPDGAAADDPSPSLVSFEGRPIVSIEVRGPTAPTADIVEQKTPLRTGRSYSAVAIRGAMDTLMKLGDWTDIRVEADPHDAGVALTLAFIPRLRISAVEFRGHHQSTAALRKAAGLRPGDPVTDAALSAAVARVRAWYEQFGYVVDITARTASDAQNTRARVTFAIRERDRLRLRSITFPGTPAFSRLRHLVALRTAPGEYVSRSHLERGIDRLRRLYHGKGYLTAVIGPMAWTATPAGLAIVVPIQQGPQYRVAVSGFDDEITAQMTFFDDPRDDEDSLAEESARLTRYLSDQGYRRAAVRMHREVAPDGTVVIRVAVDAGPRFPLREILITGNVAASDRDLQQVLETRPGGWWRARYIQRDVLEADGERIQAWYRAHGFLSTSVTVGATEADAPPRAAAVFTVDEGPQTRIGLLTLDGRDAVSLDDVLANYDLREGSPYVEARFRAARAAMLERYSERGYIYAKIDGTPTISVDRTRVDLRFRITEGPAVTIGNISLAGNERTSPRVILRELDVRAGDVYNPRRIFDNQRRVAQLGFLREVRLEPEDPETVEPVKALRLAVKERDAGSVDIGLGYANYEGPRGFAEITYRNLWGSGRRAGLRVEGSRIERKAVLSYRHPWLFDRRLDGKAALFHEVREEETRGYQLSAYGTSLGIERTLIPHLFGAMTYDYQLSHIEAFTEKNPSLLPFDEKRRNIASVTPSLVWDTRDSPFNPSSGLLATIALENASLLLGSQEQFWKVTAGASKFTPLRKSVVLALGIRGGIAGRFGEPGPDILLPPTERFYVGGRSSIRGYDEDTVGPQEAGTPTGGNILLVLNAEVRVALPGSLGLVAFWDGGNVWQDQRDIDSVDVFTYIKKTVGGGLRYNTPVGPLRLDYGHKLNWLPGESHGTLHFTLGHAF